MKRDKSIKFRVSDEELRNIREKAQKAGMTLSDYVRTNAVYGKIILYDTESIFNFGKALSAIGNNINQIAMVANSTNSIYRKDIEDMKQYLKAVYGGFKEYVRPLECEVL